MSILAILAALAIEQWEPLGERKGVHSMLSAWGRWLEQSFNGGERRHGIIAWMVGVGLPVVGLLVVHLLFSMAGSLLALALDVALLYMTLGFRQFSHYFTDIQLAVKSGDIDRARTLLDRWRGASGVVRTREEVIRLSIEEALAASHRHVFGVLLWYLILPGPTGALLYRLAAYLAWRWRNMGAFGEFARRAFHLVDWPAARVTAAAFAVVGDFEDAVYCWRTQARTWPEPNTGIVLAAGAGAMGVRLGMPVQEIDGMQPRPEIGVGEPADGPLLDSAVGLLWRALVVWMFVLTLVTLAHLAG